MSDSFSCGKRKLDEYFPSSSSSLYLENLNSGDNEADRDEAVSAPIFSPELDPYDHTHDISGELNYALAFNSQGGKEFFDFADYDAAAILDEVRHNVEISAAKHSRAEYNKCQVCPIPDRTKDLKYDNDSFQTMFKYLIEYGGIAGHCNVPKRHTIVHDGQEIKIGQWLSDQRKVFFKCKMSDHRKTGFIDLISKGMLKWDPNAKQIDLDNRWDVHFEALLRYGESHTDYNVPRGFKMRGAARGVDGIVSGATLNLGNWLHKQRTERAKGKLACRKFNLMQGIVERGLLFWNARTDRSNCRWEMCYRSFVEYTEANGHCNIPFDEVSALSDGSVTKLRFWLTKQQKLQTKGQLKPERRAKLQLLVDQGKMSWKNIVRAKKKQTVKK